MLLTYFSRVALATVGAGLLIGCKASSIIPAAELSAALPAGTPYAVLHLYRPSRLVGFAIGYDVRLNDSVVYRARNGSQAAIRRVKPGPVTISAKTEAREERIIDLQPGREYYIACTVGTGIVVGRPRLAQVAASEGSREVARIAATPPPTNPD